MVWVCAWRGLETRAERAIRRDGLVRDELVRDELVMVCGLLLTRLAGHCCKAVPMSPQGGPVQQQAIRAIPAARRALMRLDLSLDLPVVVHRCLPQDPA